MHQSLWSYQTVLFKGQRYWLTRMVWSQCSTVSVSSVGLDQIKIVHQQSSHPGVWWTLYFVKQIAPGVSKAAVKTVVGECEECQSIDPAPMHWSKGALNVNGSDGYYPL